MSEDDVAHLREALDRAMARVCPSWSADRRDDLVQVATLKLIEQNDEASEEYRRRPSSYYQKTAYCVLIDAIRRRRQKHEVPLEETTVAMTVSSPQPSPERSAADREMGMAVNECLRQLVDPRRRAVTLRLLGHSLREIGSILKYGRKRTDNLVYRGLVNLRRCLEAKGLAP